MKITVVGAGIMGLSAAWAAIKAGHSVTVIEQGAIPNEAGSSVDETRLIRHTYGSKDGYARLVGPAFEAWDRLWDDIDIVHYRHTGTLCVTEGEADWFTDSAAGIKRLGLTVERLDADDIAARFAVLNPPTGSQGFYVDTGGTLAAREIVMDLARWLSRQGAVLRTDSMVGSIDPSSGTCTLADGGSVDADKVLVAAGPWTERLTGKSLSLTASRQVSVMAGVPDVYGPAWAKMPMVLNIGAGNAGTYWVPPAQAGFLKVGDHSFSDAGDPDGDRVVGKAERMDIFARGARWLRSPELYEVKSGRTCYYTLAPEERFVVRPLSDCAWVMAGFSGHGFKFGPLLGEQVIAAIDGRISSNTISTLAAGH